MTDTQKNLAIALMEDCLCQTLTTGDLSALADIDTYAIQLRSSYDETPDIVTDDDVYRLYEMLAACASMPSLKRTYRYWRQLERDLVESYYGHSDVYFFGDRVQFFESDVVFPRY